MRELVPGKGGTLVFLLSAVAGLVVWVFSTPAASGKLFGGAAYEAAYTHPLLSFFGLPLLIAIALVAGFVSPRGFWLWGVAAVFLQPFAYAWLTVWTSSQGVPGTGENSIFQLLSLAFVTALILFALAIACTGGSAVGAGLRLLWWKLRGRQIGGPRSVSGTE